MNIKSNFRKLRVRLTFYLLLVAIIPAALVGVVSYVNSIKELEKHDTRQLEMVRDSKKSQIESYLNTSRTEISFMAQNETLIGAMKEFNDGFNKVAKELKPTEQDMKKWSSEIQNYYDQNYYPGLKKNLSTSEGVEGYLPTEEDAIILQHLYISNNPNTSTEKIKFQTAQDGSTYSKAHEKYHSTFVNFISKFGFNDAILIDDATGNIIYSAAKEVEFGTNILHGPYKNSSLTKIFNLLKNTTDKNYTATVDYDFYDPAYHMPVMFIGAPVYDGKEKIGVLVLQINSEKINNILTNNGDFQSLGLGKTGEILLIGPDSKLRSNTRFLQEETDAKVKAMKTTVLLKDVATNASKAVLNGETDSNIFKDYRNEEVLVTYTPVNIDSFKWGLSVKIDTKEAFSAALKIRNIMLIIVMIAICIIMLLSFFIARGISKPLIKVAKVAYDISQGDLTVEIPVSKRSDEIGILIRAVGDMLQKLQQQTGEIMKMVNTLASSTSQITASLTQVTAGAAETSSAVSETTATVEEVKQTVYVSNQKTKNVSLGAQQSAQVAQAGKKSTEEALEGMNSINKQMEAIAESIVALSEKSQEISELISTVDTIAEQSNLLAVNASIEAAKAGEQGKGFSVVAQEIRNLAEQSKDATKQVRTILKDIQKATSTAVMTTEQGMKVAEGGMQQAIETGNAIRTLADSIISAAQAATQIEASSQQQLVGMDQIALAMEGIKQASHQNVDSMKQLENATRELQSMGMSLKDLVNHYKV